jgi:3-dehydroquinate synthase
MPEETVVVELGTRSYDLLIGNAWLTHKSSRSIQVAKSIAAAKILLVDDENTRQFSPAIHAILNQPDRTVLRFTIPPGEPSKSLSNLNSIWEFLAEHHFDRSSAIVAIGGGVVGDLAGLAAATYMRGINWYVVPTSLIAQVDSAIGGKVGINLAVAKNLVGAFWHPMSVWIDPDFLASLPEREFRSGMAEVVKYAMIADPAFFETLQGNVGRINRRDSSFLNEIVVRCCQIKAAIVSRDERETQGARFALNYGHTFGHAIEATFGYGRFSHGEAIAIGMACAARLATNMKLLEQQVADRQNHLLTELSLSTVFPQDRTELLLDKMKLDKKRTSGGIRLVLPTKMGQVELVDWPGDELVRVAMLGK